MNRNTAGSRHLVKGEHPDDPDVSVVAKPSNVYDVVLVQSKVDDG
jgi:hypothetical protein